MTPGTVLEILAIPEPKMRHFWSCTPELRRRKLSENAAVE